MRVLVVDDSAYQRLTLSAALRELPTVSEVEAVASGEEAIRRVVTSSFDLVTLDLEMPGMDGFAVLRWLMAHRPLPVLIISDRRHERIAISALEIGAFELLGKASLRAGGLAAWKKTLAEAVLEASQIRLDLLTQRAHRESGPGIPASEPERSRARSGSSSSQPRFRNPSGSSPGLVVTASTGGPAALRDLFSSLPPRGVVVGVAQHIPAPFTRSLAARLGSATGWLAKEAVDGGEARPGTIWVAPGGCHLRFEREEMRVVMRLESGSEARRWCPSGDVLFESAAAVFGSRLVAVVLTGMGDDGAAGARAVESAGGSLICESAESALIPGMPDAASRAVPSALRLPLSMIGPEIGRKLPLTAES